MLAVKWDSAALMLICCLSNEIVFCKMMPVNCGRLLWVLELTYLLFSFFPSHIIVQILYFDTFYVFNDKFQFKLISIQTQNP